MKWIDLSNILTRRWRLMLLSGFITALVTLFALRPSEVIHKVEMRFIVGQPPLASASDDERERYYTWVTSEYIVFSISDWVNGTAFYDLILQEVTADGFSTDITELDKIIGATSYRSILLVVVQHTDPELLVATAEATTKIVTNFHNVDIPQIRLAPPTLFPIDNIPVVVSPRTTISEQLRIPLSIVLAFVLAGVAAIVAERIDKTIRSRDVADTLRIPLLGEIPAH
ncbi:MAG: hypothetical protein ACPG8W_23030 [Candidatus Promineifilaceae bacterium]